MIKEALIAIGIPIIRCGAGWAVHALEDKKVTEFEWKKLVSTTVRIGAISSVAYFGIVVPLGLDIGAIGAAAAAFVFDMLLSAIKKKKK